MTGSGELTRTPLFELHEAAEARFAPFAGYEMPLRYPPGSLAEHNHTRARASLFDISHMGLVQVSGPDHRRWLESLLPTDITGLAPGRMRYSFFTNEAGGIIDDVMVTGHEDRVDIVVNASRKEADVDHLSASAPSGVDVVLRDDVAMVALQGPSSAGVLAEVGMAIPDVFLRGLADGEIWISRSGYTGEDGFEIQVPASRSIDLARRLLAHPDVEWAGLGARDSLRLEAGLCLYGNDLDETTTPAEAGLRWAIPRRRREEGGFPGAAVVSEQLANGPSRIRVGIAPDGRAPVRAGAGAMKGSDTVGVVTSGGFGPTIGRPIAMGYVAAGLAEPGTRLTLSQRGKAIQGQVAELPFVPHRYVRSTK